jgi:OOP family OmpA-OmpF porin
MNKFLKWAIAPAVAMLMLQGCSTTVSRDIADNGRAGSVVFPDAQSAWLREGTFPNLDSLRLIAPGITKDQLYELVGRPHFAEGLYGVREWDYIFNFRTGKGAEYVTCQYKVIFDKNLTGRSFFWAPAACADRLAVQQASVTERVVERVVERAPARPVDRPVAALGARVIRMPGDLLFAFDRSGPGDLLPAGVRELDRVAAELRAASSTENIHVVGYSDRLGTEAYNLRLSKARAETVRGYFLARGFAASRLSASGSGTESPVVECHDSAHAALIACLAPNRRVELVVTAAARP